MSKLDADAILQDALREMEERPLSVTAREIVCRFAADHALTDAEWLTLLYQAIEMVNRRPEP